MIIGKISIPIYSIFILLSLIVNIVFNYIYLKKENIQKEKIFLSLFMILSFCLIGAKTMTMLLNEKSSLNLFTAGFSSYGGAIGIIIGSYIFSKMINNKSVFKSNILILPLMYSISKLGCFFAGCCYGIPHQSFFSVTYTEGLNISLVPVQLIESISFLLIFIIVSRFKAKTYVIELTVLLSAITKFILEYFRYENMNKILCCNQIVSLFLIGIVIILLLNKRKKVKQNV